MSTAAPALPTRCYRVRTSGANDGAHCFLRPAQAAVGVDLPDPLPAYAQVDRECRPVQIPLDEVLGFEEV